MGRLIAIFTVIAGSVAAPRTARALDYDPALGRLCVITDPQSAAPCGETPTADQAAFSDLVRTYGVALAPRLLAPADTLGVNGFAFAFQLGVTGVDESASFWERGISGNQSAQATPDVPASLQTLHLDLRKGLPFSLEVGAHLTWLAGSELFAVGGSFKGALNEGVAQVPVDLAVELGLSRVVGSNELEMTLTSLDVTVSHRFGLTSLSLTPYLAWSPLFIFARSGVVDSSPGDSTTPAGTYVFADEDLVVQRMTVGARFLSGVFAVTPEIVLASGHVAGNFNFGLDF